MVQSIEGMSAHNIMCREMGYCPWCGGNLRDTEDSPCSEPDGAALAHDPWSDDE